MGKIRDQNFYAVSGWMVTRLGLKGRELHAYAIIYGFTQDCETEFTGSLSYISEWLGCTKKTTIETLKSLISKGLIEKNQDEIRGIKVNYYRVILPPRKPQTSPSDGSVIFTPTSVIPATGQCNNYNGVVKKLQRGSVETTPNIYSNNIYNNNIYNLLGDSAEAENEKAAEKIPFNKIKNLYNEICQHFPKCVSLTDNRKKAIAARWKEYDQGLQPFVDLFRTAEASSFLKGRNPRNWSASLDWLLKSANMAKVLEGNYNDKGGSSNVNNSGTCAAAGSYGQAKPAAANVRTTAELEAALREQGAQPAYPDFDAI